MMGFFHNLLMCAIHLVCVSMDILVIMILIIVVYHKWQPKWLRKLNNTVEPLMVPVVAFADKTVKRITGKSLSEKHLFLVIIFSLWIIRLMLNGLFRN